MNVVQVSRKAEEGRIKYREDGIGWVGGESVGRINSDPEHSGLSNPDRCILGRGFLLVVAGTR